MTKAVVIASGGVDSTTLLYDIIDQGFDVFALSVNYNQKHAKELEFISRTCQKLKIPHKVVDLSAIGKELMYNSALVSGDIKVPTGHYRQDNMRVTVVPNRNMILISLAFSYAMTISAKKVFYGAHAGDHTIYPDCRKEFVDALRRVAHVADWEPIELEAPYLGMDKGDIVIKGRGLGVDYSLTWTCYEGKQKACGICGACTERLEAFKKAEMEDPVEYENRPSAQILSKTTVPRDHFAD
jgi:7-cyano-7-deazaguanine synthase